MTWGEAGRLVDLLLADPSSRLAAAVEGWTRPASEESLVLMQVVDVLSAAHLKNPKPWPRPWPRSSSRRHLPSAELTQDEIVAALRAAGHTAPLPTR